MMENPTMCLIIDRPESVAIPADLVHRAIDDNANGWGIMAPGRKGISARRGMDRTGFDKALRKIGAAPCTIHFRFATHGAINLNMTHPFIHPAGRYALMHNGIISTPVRDDSKSDTWHFAHDVLWPILDAQPESFGSEYLGALLGSIVGSYNKLVILRDDGATMTVNREAGMEWEGLWLSNGHSLPTIAPPRGMRARTTRDHWTARDDDDWRGGWASDDDDIATAEVIRPWRLDDFDGWEIDDIADVVMDDPYGIAAAIVSRHDDEIAF
jgi:hypothetical protein